MEAVSVLDTAPEETPVSPHWVLFATSLVPLWYLGIRGGKEVPKRQHQGNIPGDPEEPDAVPVDQARGDVPFDGVTFGYDAGKVVLRNISLLALENSGVTLKSVTDNNAVIQLIPSPDSIAA